MENTPTGRADDLPTFFCVLKNDPKSRSLSNCPQRPDLVPDSISISRSSAQLGVYQSAGSQNKIRTFAAPMMQHGDDHGLSQNFCMMFPYANLQ